MDKKGKKSKKGKDGKRSWKGVDIENKLKEKRSGNGK